MSAAFRALLPALCSCCLEEGLVTQLWLLMAGLHSMSFCPVCDGTS